MSPLERPWPRSHHDVVQYHLAQYEEDIRSGKFEPLVYPWGALGIYVVIIYLLVPHRHRPWLRNARFLVFAWFAGFQAYSMRYVRARTAVVALGFGLLTAWSIIWAMVILVFNDAQTDFQRIERMEGAFRGRSKEQGIRDEKIDDLGMISNADGDVSDGQSKDSLGPSERHGEFAWQPFPLYPFIERLDWVLDIVTNFRGVGWNWRTSSMPPPPADIQAQLHRNSARIPTHSNRVHPGQPNTYPTRRQLLIGNLQTLFTGYLMLDGLKTVMMHDRYFWGLVDDASAPAYLPNLISESPAMLRAYRLILSALGVQWALKTAFSLGPLLFSGLLGPHIIGARAEPWIYPDTWGPYSVVLQDGLAGWWSGWWHQTFRFAFQQRKLVQLAGLGRNPALAKLLQLVIAFTLSGILHACGSYTSVGPTQPIKGSLLFFLLQAIGIFGEAVLTQSFRRTGIQRHVPTWALNAVTVLYVHVWFYYTGALLGDDFAKAGTWLFQPIPLSLFRGLGLGTEGDGWWCWGGNPPVKWYTSDRWWKSGFAL